MLIHFVIMREQSDIGKIVEKIVYLTCAPDTIHSTYPQDNPTLFYGLREGGMTWFTCMATFDEVKAGYIAVQQALPRLVIKTGLVPVEDMLSLEPSEMAIRHPHLPMLHQYQEVKHAFDQYRALLGMFADNYDLFLRFQQELGKEKDTEGLAKHLAKDLDFLRPMIIDGANALRNPKSLNPVHDFLMIADPIYRQVYKGLAKPDQL